MISTTTPSLLVPFSYLHNTTQIEHSASTKLLIIAGRTYAFLYKSALLNGGSKSPSWGDIFVLNKVLTESPQLARIEKRCKFFAVVIFLKDDDTVARTVLS